MLLLAAWKDRHFNKSFLVVNEVIDIFKVCLLLEFINSI